MRWRILAVMAAHLLAICPVPGISVCNGGTCDFQSIQEAVDFAPEGSTVLVQSGVYHEAVNVNRSLAIRGVPVGSKGRPLIDAGDSKAGITVNAPGCLINNLKVINAAGAGILVMADFVRVTVCSVHGSAVGIGLWGSNGGTITGNTATDNAKGILLSSSSGATVTGNNASLNSEGIVLDGSGNSAVKANEVSFNHGSGIRLNSSSSCTIAMNNASHNHYGIFLDGSSADCLIFENVLINNTENAIDYSGSNQWDNGAIGNYYSDYQGCGSNYSKDCSCYCACDWCYNCGRTCEILGYCCRSVPGGASLDRYPLLRK